MNGADFLMQVTDSIRSGHQAMVFVHSRKDTGKTARTFVLKAQNGGDQALFDCSEHPLHALLTRDVKKSRNKCGAHLSTISCCHVRCDSMHSNLRTSHQLSMCRTSSIGNVSAAFVIGQLVSSSIATLAYHGVLCRELAELVGDGIGIHHAGMLRSDRNLVERLFREGLIKVCRPSP